MSISTLLKIIIHLAFCQEVVSTVKWTLPLTGADILEGQPDKVIIKCAYLRPQSLKKWQEMAKKGEMA